MLNTESQKNLILVLNYIVTKYENNGKHAAKIELLTNDLIAIDFYKDCGKVLWFNVQSIDEFYLKHVKWIKEIPEYHAIMMSEILGNNGNK